jgi:hypothetical protein
MQGTMTFECRVWDSTHSVRNGTNRCGTVQSHCKNCGTYRVLSPKPPPRATQGERTISLDELTEVQALERKHPDLPM